MGLTRLARARKTSEPRAVGPGVQERRWLRGEDSNL
jgi:hypothetical protein